MSEASLDHPDPQSIVKAIRRDIRAGRISGHTAGLAPGFLQGNLVILPRRYADDFQSYCLHNPKSCPLIGVSTPGDPSLPGLGADIDLRTDLPRYRVWRNGVLADEPADITALWRDDLVAFVIGCSFTFDTVLRSAGLKLRHLEMGRNVAMYRTSVPTVPVGPFRGPLVVSMRPMTAPDIIRAIEITSTRQDVHGSPVHFGSPETLGISDLQSPDYGDPVPVEEGEYPVFWACGVTPQAALAAAKPELCITHAPGCMLITDRIHHN